MRYPGIRRREVRPDRRTEEDLPREYIWVGILVGMSLMILAGLVVSSFTRFLP